MRCAIVTLAGEENEKRSLWQIFKIKKYKTDDINVINSTHNICIYTIDYTIGEICEFSEKKLNSVLCKCIKELKKRGVKSVYLTDEMHEFGLESSFHKYFKVVSGRRVFDLLLGRVIRMCADKEKIESDKAEIGVWQSSFDKHGVAIVEDICSQFKYITLFTKTIESANLYADHIYAQAGLSLKVTENISELNLCDIVIAADKLEKNIANEKTIVIDESGECDFRCKNTIEFSLPFGYNALMQYFGVCNERCVEFLLDCCDIDIYSSNEIDSKLDKIGCKIKKVLYKPHKNS